MITRIWHGWTTHQNADAYEAIVSGTVLPGIAARNPTGYHGAYLLRRELEGVDGVEEFFVFVLVLESFG